MNLGIFLTPGDSLEKYSFSGQEERFVNYYLKTYLQQFEKVFIFSYGNKKYQEKLPANVFLLANKYNFHYLLYQFLICFFYFRQVLSCDVFRVLQTTGGIPAIIAKLIFGKRIVMTYGFDYSLVAKIENKIIRSYLLKIFIKLILAFADKIIATTQKNYQLLKKAYPKKICFIANGVDSNLFKPFKKIKKEKFNILNVGRLEKQKNQKLLIEAVALSKFKNKIKITLVGNGSLKNDLLLSALNNNIRLEIINRISYMKMPQYFTGADIFCLPSLIEGSSKALLEAMSCGIPCLVSNIANNKEVIKNNGLTFSLNKKELGHKIDFLIKNNRLRKLLGEKARKEIVKNRDIFVLLEKETAILKGKNYV